MDSNSDHSVERLDLRWRKTEKSTIWGHRDSNTPTDSPTELAAVGNGTTQLLRGFVLAASDRDSDRTEAAASTLRLRIQDYIDQHLAEPDLTPERISFAHNISLRQLYLVFSQLNETPVEWIISRRLAVARVDLTYRPDTVSAIAQKWAFKDHSHFSRRFKAKYGVTPYEYIRQLNEGDPFQTI
jgi:AraC-like DNA-binding protein